MFCVDLDWLQDAELLGRLGRKPLAAVLDLVAPFFAQQDIALPDSSLPDSLYFSRLAGVFRSQPLKVAAYLPPWLSPMSQAQAPKPTATGGSSLQPLAQSRYALRRDGDLWYLTLDGRQAILTHEQGICYVAEMLSHPRERVKKLNLAAKYSSPKSTGRSSIQVCDPATGSDGAPASTEPVREASLAADDNEARKSCMAKARELKETIGDPTETEGAKAQAREELEQIIAHLKKDSRQVRDATKAAADAIRCAIKKLLHTLLQPGSSSASPDSVRLQFADHIQRYLVTPGRRYAAPRARKARGDLTGCLLYEPPAGVVWVVRQ